MADMKMKRNGNGGYLIGLTDGQLKKWDSFKREVVVDGLISNKKWEDTEYQLGIGGDTFEITVKANKDAKKYEVTVKSSVNQSILTKTYTTWECNDCIIRMVLEMKHTLTVERKNAQTKQA